MVRKNNFLFNDASAPLETRLDDLMRRLTLEEKISLVPAEQAGIGRLGILPYNIGAEGAHGFVDRDGHGTVFPQTIGLASTWDRDLLHKAGQVTGCEARAYYNTHRTGGLSLWFPTIDMERDPRWGRTEEGYGEDPYLAGELASEIISGAQGDDPFYLRVSCAPKHFFANNNEKDRGTCSNSVDPRCMHEYYLAPFRRVFAEAKPFSIMTAYNKVNGIPMMLHPAVREIVKKQWGLEGRGHVVTDGGAVGMTVTMHHYYDEHARTVAAAFRAGSDSMTDLPSLVVPAVRSALEQGLITEEELDIHVRNVLRVRMRFGHFDDPPRCPYDSIGREAVMTAESALLARRAAAESVVLLKNGIPAHGGSRLLPVCPGTGGKIAVIGVHGATVYRDWYAGNPPYSVTPLEALRETYGGSSVVYEDGQDRVSFTLADGTPVVLGSGGELEKGRKGEKAAVFARSDWGWGADTLYSEKTGKYLQTVESVQTDHQPSEAEMEQYRKKGSPGKIVCSAETTLNWFVSTLFNIIPCGKPAGGNQPVMIRSWNSGNVRTDEQGISVYSGGEPELFIMHTESDGIEAAVTAARNADTVLLFCGSNPVINGKEEVDRPSLRLPAYQRKLIRAVCAENSRTVLAVISGYPYAMKEEADDAAAVFWCAHGMQEEGHGIADVVSGAVPPAGRLPLTWYASDQDLAPMDDYDIISSRHTYQYFRKTPLYPFGFGLTYSSFEYTGLCLSRNVIDEKETDVSVNVKNAGVYDSDEVVQLYVSAAGKRVQHPLKRLCGFERVRIHAGETASVSFRLTNEAVSVWDVTREKFCAENGTCTVSVGASSADIRLSRTVPVCGEDIPPRNMRRITDAWNYDSARSCVLGEKRGSPVPAVFSADGYGELLYRQCDLGGMTECTAEICAQGNASIELRTGSADGPAAGSLDLPNTGDNCAVPGKQRLPAWTKIVIPVYGLDGIQDVFILLRGSCGIHTVSFS